MRHTPGPWELGQGNGEGSIFAKEGRMRLETGGTALYPICTMVPGWDAKEDGANALLITSSPRLVAALSRLLKQAELTNDYAESSGGTLHGACRQARELIAELST